MDITQIILDEHREQRRLFSMIEEIGPSEPEALRAIWRRLKALLDSHAEAEERFFYPRLLEVGQGANDADSAAEETEDAIEDHNDIRNSGDRVDRFEVGTPEWFDAVAECNLANSKHMAEEERQGLTDFRQNASIEERHSLAIRFVEFEAKHVTGVEPVDKNPKAYVKEHSPAD